MTYPQPMSASTTLTEEPIRGALPGYARSVSLDQERLVSLVRELFDQPFEQVVNNDLPLEEPLDVNWADDTGTAYRLRLYVEPSSVLAVSQTAQSAGLPWEHEKRVLVLGGRAAQVARELESVVTAAREE